MKIHQAIALYKHNIADSIHNMKPFTAVGCGMGCRCVKAIEWDDLKFHPEHLIVKKYRFRLSLKLSNQLENLWLPLIQPGRTGHTMHDRDIRFRNHPAEVVLQISDHGREVEVNGSVIDEFD